MLERSTRNFVSARGRIDEIDSKRFHLCLNQRLQEGIHDLRIKDRLVAADEKNVFKVDVLAKGLEVRLGYYKLSQVERLAAEESEFVMRRSDGPSHFRVGLLGGGIVGEPSEGLRLPLLILRLQ